MYIFLKKYAAGWLTPVIPATQEAEIRRMAVWSQPGQTVCETLSCKTHHQKGLMEWLKVWTMSSNPSTSKKKSTRLYFIELISGLIYLLCWGWNPGPWTCRAIALSLSYAPSSHLPLDMNEISILLPSKLGSGKSGQFQPPILSETQTWPV
jgi:hypothetical protein